MPQKKRTTKSSSHERRSSKPVKLSVLEKALISGGIIRSSAAKSEEAQRKGPKR